ncbi:MAG: patatin-like phospholipase family protein [Deltaproteobacteria bacterium]|nr:patatin-like phospholipase family protein [Deltaproteobacteria bacterium]MBW2499252.1 patatin-like phospholipase family protein [Deltaproteobacteria bacterium]
MIAAETVHAPARARPKRAIVLSGGGARGAYEAGVLRFILDDLPKRTGVKPDVEIVCGTSVGAIHACFLAATADEHEGRGDHLVGIWDRMRVHEIFHFTTRDFFRLPRRMLGVKRMAQKLREGQRPDRLYGLLNTEPLERLVLQSIPWRGIRRNLRTGRIDTVCVAATQIATGRAVVFCDSGRPELPPWGSVANIRMQRIRLSPLHALASASIPLLFPSVRVGARYYADGGLRLNTPLAPAVRLGADRILVIGLTHPVGPSMSEALAQERTAEFGNPMYLFGKVLNALMLSPIEADVSRLHFVNDILATGREVYGDDFLEKLNANLDPHGMRAPLKHIHDLVIRPSSDLGFIASEVVRDSPELDLGAFLGMLQRTTGAGTSAREADLLSYLLFDAAYAKPLIELGHRDAEARESELAAFFSDPGEA